MASLALVPDTVTVEPASGFVLPSDGRLARRWAGWRVRLLTETSGGRRLRRSFLLETPGAYALTPDALELAVGAYLESAR